MPQLTDSPAEPISPPYDLQCIGRKRDGTRCSLKRAQGYGEYCRAHGMTPEERAALSAAGHAARTAQRQAREDAVERGRMGLQGLLALRLEEHADAVVARLLDIVAHGNDADALRAAETLMSRVYGRPVQPTEDLTPSRQPTTVDEVRAMSPAERRELLAAVL